MTAHTPRSDQAGGFRQRAIDVLRDRAHALRNRAVGYEALADALETLNDDSESVLRVGDRGETAIWDLLFRVKE
jgi:hypothetical protein